MICLYVIGIFVSAAVKELRDTALGTLLDVVMRYTMVAVSQQAGPLVNSEKNEKCSFGMDPLVLIDSMATVMSYQEKELLKPARLALTIILNTATIIMGSKERVLKPLNFCNYLKLFYTCTFYRPANYHIWNTWLISFVLYAMIVLGIPNLEDVMLYNFFIVACLLNGFLNIYIYL